jgi:hypothetical protein
VLLLLSRAIMKGIANAVDTRKDEMRMDFILTEVMIYLKRLKKIIRL